MTDTGANIIDLEDFDKGGDGDVKMLSQSPTPRLTIRPLLPVSTHSPPSLSGLSRVERGPLNNRHQHLRQVQYTPLLS